jgi:hypothetical protein
MGRGGEKSRKLSNMVARNLVEILTMQLNATATLGRPHTGMRQDM